MTNTKELLNDIYYLNITSKQFQLITFVIKTGILFFNK